MSYFLNNGITGDTSCYLTVKGDVGYCSYLLYDSISFPFQNVEMKHDTVVVILEDHASDFYYNKGIKAEFIKFNGKWYNNSMTFEH
jgi:hypothetical protein